MRFSVATLLAFAASALAQTAGFDVITAPTEGSSISAGKTFTIEWEPTASKTGTVTLTLLGGSTPSTLQLLDPIKVGVASSAGTYSWTVDSSLGEYATYGIKLSYDADPSVFQYSFPFKIAKAAAAPVSSASSKATSAVTSASASSSSAAAAAPATTSSVSSPASSSAWTAPVSTTLYTTATSTVACSTSSVAYPTAPAAATNYPTASNGTFTPHTNKTGPAPTSPIVTAGASSFSVAGSLAAAAAFVAMFAAL